LPRYHFHVEDGRSYPDPDGTELASAEAARHEAVRLAGRLLEDHAREFWDTGRWWVKVTDDAGRVLFRLELSAHDETGDRVAAASAG
jgi:hypothetical protein